MSSSPSHPVVGVGAVVVRGSEVLLIKRGKDPLRGRWLVPGGTVELGETLAEAVVREVREETGLDVVPGEVVFVFDRIDRDATGIRYHYVIIDYVCTVAGGTLQAGSDAEAAVFVALEDLPQYDVPAPALDLIRRVMASRSV